IAALNTRFSERALFSGVSAETQPLPDPGTILSAIEAAITSAGASTVGDVQSAIADWFDDPLGYQALYAGGGPRADVPVAAGETADLSVTALDPAIKDTLRGLATMALLGRGLMAGQVEARSDMAKAAGEDLLTGSESRSHLMARVGTVQAQIAAAQTRNTAEESALSITRAGIISADPYDAATRLEDLQTRIEALYLVTARVSRLSLADYL
ncbi:MAG: flagellar biosynthesis protein FlgL, partial [Fuscovulum sp.]|nr:flagellar biosynthesis protein FlgL [Fuscovulum sp.]